ncbi:IS5/IS1182 family transposase, partial [Natrarchaeobius oligotrophus]
HARVEVYLGLCLRVIVAITNYEQGENPGRTKLVA